MTSRRTRQGRVEVGSHVLQVAAGRIEAAGRRRQGGLGRIEGRERALQRRPDLVANLIGPWDGAQGRPEIVLEKVTVLDVVAGQSGEGVGDKAVRL